MPITRTGFGGKSPSYADPPSGNLNAAIEAFAIPGSRAIQSGVDFAIDLANVGKAKFSNFSK